MKSVIETNEVKVSLLQTYDQTTLGRRLLTPITFVFGPLGGIYSWSRVGLLFLGYRLYSTRAGQGLGGGRTCAENGVRAEDESGVEGKSTVGGIYWDVAIYFYYD